jgi:hypothetical protein
MVSACASVLATTKSTPSQASGDHVVDSVAAATADTEDGDAGLQLGDVRLLQLDRHCPRSFLRFSAASPSGQNSNLGLSGYAAVKPVKNSPSTTAPCGRCGRSRELREIRPRRAVFFDSATCG